MFAKVFETPRGQFLIFKCTDDEDMPAITVMVQPNITVSAKLSYDTEEEREEAWTKIEEKPEYYSEALFNMANQMGGCS